jgi:hypothetical protein
MLSKLWDKLGEGLSERWLLTVLSPAFAFWFGGLWAYATRHGVSGVTQHWTSLSLFEQAVLVIGALLLVTATAWLVEASQGAILRLLEGYWPWPFRGLRFARAEAWRKIIDKKYKDRGELEDAITISGLSRKAELDDEIARLPANPLHIMPTLLGNVLAGAEHYPQVRYGLGISVCWSRLYLVLPSPVREEIVTSRARIDESIRLIIWSALFVVWTVWQGWALFGLIAAWIGYRNTIAVSGVYADLIRAAFDLHRFELYEQLRFPVPRRALNEEECGEEVSEYLLRGEHPRDIMFEKKPTKSENTPGDETS